MSDQQKSTVKDETNLNTRFPKMDIVTALVSVIELDGQNIAVRQLISQETVDAVFETTSIPDLRFIPVMLDLTEVLLNTSNIMATSLRKRLERLNGITGHR